MAVIVRKPAQDIGAMPSAATRRGGGAGEIRTREPSYPGYGISSADSMNGLVSTVAEPSTLTRLELDCISSSTLLQRHPVSGNAVACGQEMPRPLARATGPMCFPSLHEGHGNVRLQPGPGSSGGRSAWTTSPGAGIGGANDLRAASTMLCCSGKHLGRAGEEPHNVMEHQGARQSQRGAPRERRPPATVARPAHWHAQGRQYRGDCDG